MLAQTAATGERNVSAAQTYASGLYANAFGPNAHLLNGTEYVNYSRENYVGHQFLAADAPQEGSLYYDGFFYPKIPLLYDIRLDQLVLHLPDKNLDLSLVSAKASKFVLYGRTFIYLATDSATGVLGGPGFFDMLLDGKARLLAKRRKVLVEETTRTGKEGTFTEHDLLFLQLGRAYYRVGTGNQILGFFPSQKAALRTFIRSRHLSFADEDWEGSVRAVVEYYNTLPQ